MTEKLSDHQVDVRVNGPEVLARGFFPYERYQVALPDSAAGTHPREIVRVGRVVMIVALDLARDEIVLLRQFRLGAHLADGRGELVEIPAGRVEPGEELSDAARRECLEEIGVAPQALVPLFSVLPSPGMSDEQQFFFLGLVDASKVPERAGAADEREETRPLRVRIGDALAALANGELHYGGLVLGLQWLALNRERLAEIARRRAEAR